MTREEIVAKLDAMSVNSDEEVEHGKADKLLCEALRLAGMYDVANAFENARERVGFWYA